MDIIKENLVDYKSKNIVQTWFLKIPGAQGH